MNQPLSIAIVGATGSIGEALVGVLDERDFPVKELHLLASDESAGQSLSFRDRQVRVRSLEGFDFARVQLVFFAAGAEVTREHVALASAAGCSVIDLSAGLSLAQAPCVMPEDGQRVMATLKAPFVLSSPTPSAVALALVLQALRPLLLPRQVVVTAMLAVSALGRSGVQELARQTTELLNGRPLEPRALDRQIAFNVLAQVGAANAQGHAQLEERLVQELQMLGNDPQLKVAVTCAVVPVFFGDSLAVSLQADAPVDLAAVVRSLEQAQGIELAESGDYPTVVGDAVGQDSIHVGRLRCGISDPTQLNLWIASDNVRKGAALNAVQIAELLIKHYL
ncbi:USG-1 protein homolog [Pseudomonas sp. 8Z]|uniref:aspartate-semialdehyde dehydrogenase n=1 Tax=Pseudomonas sp. 8Z TaxID=2653166 RepID=UPI0012F21F75|nr:aspartate-semialdehyde dehydrogenase [Pseudomonas sp. 8Z]VXC37212.1 USG-1 protein homolog [Pseudomonas sp. 8Z]